MLFNSFDFIVFILILFPLFWWSKNRLKLQNVIILVGSYVFYGFWDWRFLGLIILSTLIDFYSAKSIERAQKLRTRKLFLGISLVMNLGMLMYFKYVNFFIDSFVDTFRFFGVSFTANRLDIVLPVGISFYTFQTLSYTIDVYRKKLAASDDIISFAAYVSFFPQLVAGPIERATQLLPQFGYKKVFKYETAVIASRLILWGLFKKVVVADSCAPLVDEIFSNYETNDGWTNFLGAILFSIQIYGDFSGYSDIAIGLSRLLGFNLMRNFAFPYFSRDVAEFWRRWHISLSTWFRDYVYIPLGGSRVSIKKQIRNTFIIFLVSGFWHGANWTFIAWGGLNALYFLPLLLRKKNRKHTENIDSLFPHWTEFLSMIGTYLLICLAWIFFRSDNVKVALEIIKSITFNPKVFDFSQVGLLLEEHVFLIVFILFLFMTEWFNRKNDFGLYRFLDKFPSVIRWMGYASLIYFILMFAKTEQVNFIYFQF